MVLCGNHEPSLPERTAGALKIRGEWTKPSQDISQIDELVDMIKKHRDIESLVHQ
jgi:hypothetical protein